MENNAALSEGSPPYLHTRYLTAAEQAHCSLSPTYSASLSSVQALRQDVQYAQIALDVSRRTKHASKRQLAEKEHKLKMLEDSFTAEDNILAELAEVLISCPVFWHTQEVQLVDGQWIWHLPKLERLERIDRAAACPERLIPRHETRETTFVRQPGPTPARKLSQRLTRGLSKLVRSKDEAPAKLSKKAPSIRHF